MLQITNVILQFLSSVCLIVYILWGSSLLKFNSEGIGGSWETPAYFFVFDI